MPGRDRYINEHTVTSDYLVPVNMDYVHADASAGPITIRLQNTLDRMLRIHKVNKADSSVNLVTVTDGTMSYVLVSEGEGAMFELGTDGLFRVYAASRSAAVGGETNATNTLVLADDVVEDETVTIGADVYDIEIVNTDSTDDTDNDDFNNETNPLTVVAAVTTYSNVTFTEGALIRIESEILRVAAVDGDDVTFRRGASGTTVAAHADGEDIFAGDGIAGTIAVGLVTTLTPAAFAPALIADINSEATEPVTASDSGDNVVITASSAGTAGNGIECDETLAGAGNAWLAATTFGGHGIQVGAIRDEIPAGDVDGANQDFEFVGTPFAVFLDGVKYGPNEYSISGTIVTISTPPASGVVSGLTQ